jgi:hypothetical protein
MLKLRLHLAVGWLAVLPLLGLAGLSPRAEAAAETLDAQRRCLALVAYAEAAGEGRDGMAAVIKVMRNRMRDPRFPADACAVAVQPGQFQPVGERPMLRQALEQPTKADLIEALGGSQFVDRQALALAVALAAGGGGAPDPTGGALYFVNPDLMDPDKCPWFAGLKRTASIGAHVFMDHYAPGEIASVAALDCTQAGRGRGKLRRTKLATPVTKPPIALASGRLRPELASNAGRLLSGYGGTSARTSLANGRVDYRIEAGVYRRAGASLFTP